jgi:hypothetical protein
MDTTIEAVKAIIPLNEWQTAHLRALLDGTKTHDPRNLKISNCPDWCTEIDDIIESEDVRLYLYKMKCHAEYTRPFSANIIVKFNNILLKMHRIVTIEGCRDLPPFIRDCISEFYYIHDNELDVNIDNLVHVNWVKSDVLDHIEKYSSIKHGSVNRLLLNIDTYIGKYALIAGKRTKTALKN